MIFIDPWDNVLLPEAVADELEQTFIDSGNLPPGLPEDLLSLAGIVSRMWVQLAAMGDAEYQVLIEEITAIRSTEIHPDEVS